MLAESYVSIFPKITVTSGTGIYKLPNDVMPTDVTTDNEASKIGYRHA
jgi:hypothetical protein